MRALAQVEVLNQQIAALRRQLQTLEDALDVSEKKDKDAQSRIADLGQRLNVALAQRVQELSRYRSDFFGRLRAILGNRPDIRIVGDRFVFQSEVFFDTGQAVLKPEGRAELDGLATALLELEQQDPAGDRLGAAGRRPYRPARRSTARSSRATGSSRPRAPSRWCNISSAGACRRSAWSPPASANSSRSTPTGPRKPSPATAASS